MIDTSVAGYGNAKIGARWQELSPAHRVRAGTEITDFNQHFSCALPDTDADTIGGLLINHFGRVPKRGEAALIEGFKFQVMRADSRQVHLLRVEHASSAP